MALKRVNLGIESLKIGISTLKSQFAFFVFLSAVKMPFLSPPGTKIAKIARFLSRSNINGSLCLIDVRFYSKTFNDIRKFFRIFSTQKIRNKNNKMFYTIFEFQIEFDFGYFSKNHQNMNLTFRSMFAKQNKQVVLSLKTFHPGITAPEPAGARSLVSPVSFCW